MIRWADRLAAERPVPPPYGPPGVPNDEAAAATTLPFSQRPAERTSRGRAHPRPSPTIRAEMTDAPIPDLILYSRPGCGLCDETRTILEGLLAQRATDGLPALRLVERDIEGDRDLERAFSSVIPVVELGDRRLELATSAAKLRRLLADA